MCTPTSREEGSRCPMSSVLSESALSVPSMSGLKSLTALKSQWAGSCCLTRPPKRIATPLSFALSLCFSGQGQKEGQTLGNYLLTDNQKGHYLCYLGAAHQYQLYVCAGHTRLPACSRCSITLGVLESEHSANLILCP